MFSRTILLFAALLSTPLAHALGLGAISGNGALGERLDARVPLVLAPGERATLRGVDVLPDMFERDVATPIDTLRATLAADGDRTYIHVTSTAPIAVERMRFRLRVNTDVGAVVSRYAVRALPPRVAAPTARDVRDAPRIVSRSPARVAVPAIVPSAGNSYGPVRSGESLWTIAKQLAGNTGVQSTMQALHALNPEAFVGGDMNRLRVGVTLRVPATLESSVTSAATSDMVEQARVDTDRATTRNDTTAQTMRVDAQREAPAADTDALDALIAEDTQTLDEASVTQAPTSPSAAQVAAPPVVARTTLQDPALVQRLAELDAKFAAIRARYAGAQSTRAPTTGVAVTHAPVVTAAPAPSGQPSPATTKPAAVGSAARTPVAAAPTPREISLPATPAPRVGMPTWAITAGVAVLALVVLLILLPRLRHRVEAWRTRVSVASVKADDAGLKAEVARKAENRVRLESEIHELLSRKTPAPAAAPAIAAASPLTANTLPPVSPFEQTVDPLAITSGGSLLENDREVAIDANIAHGRYAEAEALLREVIEAHSRNVQAKLRLAEVYYITEKVDGFATVAVDIKDNHRPDLTDEEWQRVVRMGKIIAPDLALFSGPKAVGKRA